MFCDLTKVFDCVNHYILLSKLNFYKINGKANKWMKSHLRDRYQRLKIKNKNVNHNTVLNWEVIKHGVPQGSILGHLLFLLYTNNLSKTITEKSKPVLFTDNTSIIFTNSNLVHFKIM